jgi:hypothetical protein
MEMDDKKYDYNNFLNILSEEKEKNNSENSNTLKLIEDLDFRINKLMLKINLFNESLSDSTFKASSDILKSIMSKIDESIEQKLDRVDFESTMKSLENILNENVDYVKERFDILNTKVNKRLGH